jgi:very-short-patch-repair endonuclease
MANRENHNLYNSNLRQLAHGNRYTMTKAEACLWKYALKAKMMGGYTFNRQRPVLNYIADFMCKKLQLIIEVDGFTHTLDEVIENDEIRQQNLENAGFVVIRFADEEVLKDIENVKRVIESVIGKLEMKITQ